MAAPSADPSPTRSRLPLIAGVIVLMLAVGIGGFLYLTRDTSEEKLTVKDAPSGTGEAVDTAALDGTWTVAAGTGDEATTAGYRIQEVFVAGARKNTATARTPDVTGDVTVEGGKVTAASFTVDMTTLDSGEGRRDGRMRGEGLQTDEFKTATFELSGPVALPALRDGKAVTLEAAGKLTLHGVTKDTTLSLTVRATGDAFVVQGSAPVVLADHDIDVSSLAGFADVADDGELEFLVNLTKG
jgi:polyisoprenoid-binding protein YceI